jgi:nucleotide-binding universal stress UspA family protein
MLHKVLLVVDGSLPSPEASALADSLLPKATEVLILHIVPQLPQQFICWPAFPDLPQELAKAGAYVSALREDLERLGRNVRTRVHFSPLSAAETDQEILQFAETHPPDLICLALTTGSMISSVVRRAGTPVLVARPVSTGDETTGRKEEIPQYLEAVRAQRELLANPAAALAF